MGYLLRGFSLPEHPNIKGNILRILNEMSMNFGGTR
jgi:hypothetical protein